MLFLLHCTGYIYRTDATGSWIRSSGDPRRQCCAAAPPSPASRVGLVGGAAAGRCKSPGRRSMSELKAERSLRPVRALIPVDAGTHAAHRALFLDLG
eukprot:scaffold11490_cov67-Phaeocystis_antarctica.AAC.1